MKPEKKFDAVKMMRDIRDKLSEKFSKMTFEEQRKYLDERAKLYHQKRKIRTGKMRQPKRNDKVKQVAR